jgi:hypothetical protein
MKGYLITTGSLFGLLTVVHIWRMVVEPGSRDVFMVLITLLSTAFAVWAWRLFTTSRPAP